MRAQLGKITVKMTEMDLQLNTGWRLILPIYTEGRKTVNRSLAAQPQSTRFPITFFF
jgi:hypothetical protein